MSQAEDILLVSQVNLFGRRRAFDTLVRKYQGPVRRLLMGLTAGDRELSADIAQDTFLKAWMYIGTYKATAKFQTWLFSIAYTVFYDYMNLCKKHSHEDIDAKEYFLTNDDASGVEKNIDLYRALEKIRPEQRTAIVLFYLEGQKQDHIDRILDVTPYGKEQLAKLLKR